MGFRYWFHKDGVTNHSWIDELKSLNIIYYKSDQVIAYCKYDKFKVFRSQLVTVFYF
jgi:hypothetical protein